jgi:hypothetical protein
MCLMCLCVECGKYVDVLMCWSVDYVDVLMTDV